MTCPWSQQSFFKVCPVVLGRVNSHGGCRHHLSSSALSVIIPDDCGEQNTSPSHTVCSIWQRPRKLILFDQVEEGWATKIWCFQTVVLEKTPESPLNYKEIKPVNPKGNHSWIFIGRTDAEAEAPVLWPPDVKSWLIRKDSNAGKEWAQEKKRVTEDEMVGWHHQFNGH